jgi:hypothetical protein
MYLLGMCTQQDSIVGFNTMAHKDLTTMANGRTSNYSGSFSTGAPTLQLALTGSYRDNLGTEKMNNFSASRYQDAKGQPVPGWLLRPNQQNGVSGTMSISAQPSPSANIVLAASGTHQSTTGSDNTLLAAEQITGDTTGLGKITQVKKKNELVDHYTASLSPSWHPTFPWPVATGLDLTLGVDNATQNANRWTLADLCIDGCSSLKTQGEIAKQTAMTYTVNGRMNVQYTMANGLAFRTSAGEQYTRVNTSNANIVARDFPTGNLNLANAASTTSSGLDYVSATAGWYLEQMVSVGSKLFLTAAFRQDAGSAFGRAVRAPLYPKFGASWVAVNEPLATPLLDAISSLRFRLTYGQSAVQPGLADRDAQYTVGTVTYDGTRQPTLIIGTPGNALLEPERTGEVEGGFDLGLWNERVTLTATMFRKRSQNALVNQSLPPSIGTGTLTQMQNVGSVVNQGTEITASVRAIDTRQLSWDMSVSGSGTRNKLVTLGPNVTNLPSNPSAMIRVGYPLFSQWYYPIFGYQDLDHDGRLSTSEITYGDSLVYAGWPQPRYSVNYNTSVGFFNGQVRVTANVSYQNGVAQTPTISHTQALTDWNASLADQAAQLRSSLTGGQVQMVNVTRWDNLGVTFTLSPQLARTLHARGATVSVFGTNLGLWTQYIGDPGVNSLVGSGGEMVRDGAVIPQSRNYTLRVNLNF